MLLLDLLPQWALALAPVAVMVALGAGLLQHLKGSFCMQLLKTSPVLELEWNPEAAGE